MAGTNHLPRKTLEPRIVSNISEFARAEDSFQNAGHVGVEKRLGSAMAKYHHCTSNILSDARQLLDLAAVTREGASACHDGIS